MKLSSLLIPMLAAACLVPAAQAQKLDLRSVSSLRKTQLQRNLPSDSRHKARAKADGDNAMAIFTGGDAARIAIAQEAATAVLPEYVMAFVTIADGFTADDLTQAGFDLKSVYGNLAIVRVARDKAEELSALDCVKAMSLQKSVNTSMDLARKEQGIDLIHHGSSEAGLSVPYTGKGVITSVVDQGVDPHHINFRYANGTSRISYLSWLRVNAAGTDIAEDHYNYTNISGFRTDNAGTFHGTHTLGILTGSYDGPVTVAKPWADPTVPEPAQYIRQDCEYYGVAPAADVAVSCGDLADIFIAYGMQNILNYAEWMREQTNQPWPLVWNLSLGSNAGPRDPRSQMAQLLDTLGHLGIVCISAGNEGDLKIALNKTFDKETKSFKTLIYPYLYQRTEDKPGSYFGRTGSVEVWSNDSTPFKLKAVIYNKKRGYRPAFTMAVVGDNIGTYYCSSDTFKVTDTDVIGDPTFSKAYRGYVGVGSKRDEQTGRYYGMIDYYIYNTADNADDNWVLGFEVEGTEGQRIDCYGDGTSTWMDSYGIEGFTDGSTDGTISDMAVANNIIVVGSYNTRNQWLCLDGGMSRYEGPGFTVGGISGFSSYGTMADGRILPTVCAPGSAIISSVSWPFIQNVLKSYDQDYLNMMCQAKEEETDRVNYWKQEVGTSMSTPFLAGSVALWLEANPYLKVDDIKDIIAKTAIRDEQVKSTREQARWGAGKFNALEGLKEAIRRASGAPGITMDTTNDRLILTSEGGRIYKVFVGATDRLDTRVYSTDGRLVYSASESGDEMTIDLSQLQPGVYIVNVNGRHSSRILIK